MGRTVIVIGGGASGLTAAICAAGGGAAVTLLEHMPRVGKKILCTGNGRCNMTNLNIGPGFYHCGVAGFPMRVVGRFPPSETLRFFRGLGVLTKERDGYVYPLSGQAQTVLDALRNGAEKLGVRVICDCEALSAKKDGKFIVNTSLGDFAGDALIIAAGSRAAPHTGSDGSGYALAGMFGHNVIKPLPALVQLRCAERSLKGLAGIRAEGRICLYKGSLSPENLMAEDTGELQLVEYGLSGIPVFQVSRHASVASDKGWKVFAAVDFMPSMAVDGLIDELKKQRRYLQGRRCGAFLDGFFNKRLSAFLLKEAGIDAGFPVDKLTDGMLSRLAGAIKRQVFSVTGVNPYERAQTCAGGVSAEEIDPGTMESRLVRGLFFAGEIVDVDGACGGYNLQWAWSSGYVAGRSAGLDLLCHI